RHFAVAQCRGGRTGRNAGATTGITGWFAVPSVPLPSLGACGAASRRVQRTGVEGSFSSSVSDRVMLRHPGDRPPTRPGEGCSGTRYPVRSDQVGEVRGNPAGRGYLHDLVTSDRAVP